MARKPDIKTELMTPEEAIEILTPLTKARREGLSLEEALAVQRVIEALKYRLQLEQEDPLTIYYLMLRNQFLVSHKEKMEYRKVTEQLKKLIRL